MASDNKLLVQERRQRILEIISTNGTVSVRDLTQEFDVSSITIIRDLQELEQQGLILRIHGGAISIRHTSFEPPFSTRETHHLAEKARIAAKAIELIQDGDSLILDVGTTTLEIARALKGKHNLTILVTNLRAASALASQSALQVVVIGGKLRLSELSMVGHLTEETLRQFQVDKAFLGAGGINLEQGLTEFNLDEAGTKRVMIERARQRIVVADHTKLGQTMLNTVAPLHAIDTIITNSEADAGIIARLREEGIEIVLA